MAKGQREEKLYQLESPVPQSLYPTLATLLLILGLAATAAFFLYQVSQTRHSKSLRQEIVLAGTASVFLGTGTLFLLLWTGVYV
jgi:hypothetical protein